jgi:hypothetical protein
MGMMRHTTATPAVRPVVAGRLAATLVLASCAGCTTIDPGPDFTAPISAFDPDYFYCHVEPEYLVAKKCGPGDPSKGDAANGCHFNPSVVTGMALRDHPPVDCGGGDHPVNQTQIGTGGAAQSNFELASLEMSRQYTTAPIFVRPSGSNHPRSVFSTSDTQVNQILATWASK